MSDTDIFELTLWACAILCSAAAVFAAVLRPGAAAVAAEAPEQAPRDGEVKGRRGAVPLGSDQPFGDVA